MGRKNAFKKYDLYVSLIAPSKGTDEEKLSRARKRLEFLGINDVRYRKNILRKKLGYWAGDLVERAKEINDSFSNKNVNFIWALSGGMGSLGLTDKIDFDIIKRNRKFFVGFSDLTSLQISMLKHAGLESVQFHMPGIKSWFNNEEEVRLFRNVLELRDNLMRFNKENICSEGSASGQLVGGCLTLLCSSMGTPGEVETQGKILYIEETNGTPQRLYNDLSQLRLAGKFEGIKGLLFSKITNCRKYKPFLKLFIEELNLKGVPVLIDLDGGHSRHKFPFIVGGKCSIDTKNKTATFGFSDKFKKEMMKSLQKG